MKSIMPNLNEADKNVMEKIIAAGQVPHKQAAMHIAAVIEIEDRLFPDIDALVFAHVGRHPLF